jgi:hypothetical protein
MRQRVEENLTKLRAEFEQGQKMLSDLEGQQANLQSMLLRISGAIQALEELLATDTPQEEPPGQPPGAG